MAGRSRKVVENFDYTYIIVMLFQGQVTYNFNINILNKFSKNYSMVEFI